ncbi:MULTISPECIES: helix-turn-helix domain-containing protein [unclassified Cyanobium]|uniref:helix-turn-helix domain-containing protein n=1 Tax=unclassified Cyanobium TaxID=2627006 RepID=UPI0020CC1D4F|nr:MULTISPECIES: helix-turn-helix transcriptional regulator [unclassified Cyanobium]MCP9776366.1 helix-turn-helix transcriptional regulator [Cyanobium sp. Tous-M-B4]MCP9876789.1 helix-turn-helix transcriptional regulator [Cyanobium sp. A2C-AMD]
MDTRWSARIDGPEALASLLDHQFVIEDLEPLQPRLQGSARLQLQAASAVVGEVGFSSVLGTPLTLAVDPREQLCLLALPSVGWGQYQLDGEQVDNSHGRTVAFLPARGWRLVNDATGGTAIQFREAALISRLQTMAERPSSATLLAARLAAPFAVDINQGPCAYHHRHLLAALALVDGSFRMAQREPDPMLCLDDLVLRCVALLLQAHWGVSSEAPQLSGEQLNLRSSVQELMVWMRANLQRPLALSELEQHSGYGRRSLQMGFKAEVGCGPVQWLRRQRLEQARRMLERSASGLSVSEVAQACGYLSLSGFSRDFRERFGMSPRQVRYLRMARSPKSS